MKTREEQLTEMAQVIDNAATTALNTLGSHNNGRGEWYAEKLHDAGYRKQSDTVREFVERAKEIYNKGFYSNIGDYDMFWLWSDIIHLAAEEYGVEVEE